MVDRFEATIDKFVADSQQKMLSVTKNAIQDTIEDAQTPVAKGGRMRVDTGFLRQSGLGQLNAIPRGESKRDRKQRYQWTGDQLQLVLARMKFGDVFYWGWTAEYARIRETYDGFLDAAVQKWSQNVNRQITKMRDR